LFNKEFLIEPYKAKLREAIDYFQNRTVIRTPEMLYVVLSTHALLMNLLSAESALIFARTGKFATDLQMIKALQDGRALTEAFASGWKERRAGQIEAVLVTVDKNQLKAVRPIHSGPIHGGPIGSPIGSPIASTVTVLKIVRDTGGDGIVANMEGEIVRGSPLTGFKINTSPSAIVQDRWSQTQLGKDYPTILAKWTELENLAGSVSAELAGKKRVMG
jgi:hypothetical protein